MNKTEILKTIPNFPDYAITQDGHVWSKPRKSLRGNEPGRWLQHSLQLNGYFYTHLSRDGKEHHVRVCRLVLETFVGPCPTGMECRHLDGNKQNDNLLNLRWGTHRENIGDAIEQGTHCCLRAGELSNRTELSDKEVMLIFNMYHDGAYMQQELADHFKVSDVHISRIVNKKTRKYLWDN